MAEEDVVQVHTRVNGWCHQCGGTGVPPAEHLDRNEDGTTWLGSTGWPSSDGNSVASGDKTEISASDLNSALVLLGVDPQTCDRVAEVTVKAGLVTVVRYRRDGGGEPARAPAGHTSLVLQETVEIAVKPSYEQ